MADFVAPIITKLYWGGFDLQNLMYVLYKHFDTSPTSLFTASLQTEIVTDSLGPGTYSFLLTPDAAGETWQLNFRNSGTQGSPNATAINLGIDPQATIVNSSSNPPSVNSEFSGETSALRISTGADTDGTAFILEFPDAVCVLLPSGAADPWQIPNGFLAGKVWTPPFANDPSLGRDGLAILGHIPRVSVSDAGLYWLTSDASSISLFRHSTNSWSNQVAAGLAAAAAQTTWLEEGGATSPGPIPIVSNARILGVMKYLLYMAPVQTPLKMIEDNKGVQRYLTLQADVAGAVIPWDSSTVPTQYWVDGPGVATYADLPTTGVSGGELEKVTTGTAQGVYQYVSEVGGESFGMWLPSDYANRVEDYIRDGSGFPCKISMPNGVGSDTKDILFARGWANAGTILVTDGTGDLVFSGGASQSLIQFVPVTADVTERQLLLVAEVDVVTASEFRTRMVFRGRTTNTLTEIISWSLDGVGNKVGYMDNAETGQVGQGSLSLGSFERMFGSMSIGWTNATNSPARHLWRSSTGQVVGDASSLVSDNTLNNGFFVNLGTWFVSGSAPIFHVREFHIFNLLGG